MFCLRNTNLLVGMAIVFATLTSTGCVSTAVMDTAKAIEPGEQTTTTGVVFGTQKEGMLLYSPPGNPDGGPDIYPKGGSNLYPDGAYQYEWMTRYSFGLGYGLQTDLAVIAPMPIGIGLELGLKWELPIPDGEFFALAVTGRGGTSAAGLQGLWMALAYAEAGAIASIHPGGATAFYVAPRIRADFLYHRVPGSESATTGTAKGSSYGSAVGFEITNEEAQSRYFELSILRSPHVDRPDGWRVTVGVGFRDGSPDGGLLPW